MPDLLSGLNPQQVKAVTASPGPTLILAGPGSGKTRVLTNRIAYLIQQGTPPFRIMAVTFTNKAAREMRERVEKLLGGELGGLTIGTFHSICARFLRREAGSAALGFTRDFVIFDDADQLAVAKQAMEKFKLDDKQYRPQSLLASISKAKNELISPEEFKAETYFAEIAGRVYAEYQKLLRLNNALDFDDLLTETAYLFRHNPDVLARYQQFYDHVLVDEFQDTNTAQYTLLRQLTATKHNLYVVGDPDQSVYRWRGADYRNVRRFQDDHPEAITILLEQNYRSTQLILDAAMAVIDRNVGRTRKQLFTERDGGRKIEVHEAYNEDEEGRYIVEMISTLALREKLNPGDAAVMYRTNAQSRAIENAFIQAGLPYRLVGGTRFYSRREVKDVLAFLRLVHNPADSVSLMRVINVPPRGLGAKTLEGLQRSADSAGIPPSVILRDLGEKRSKSEYATLFTGKAGGALGDFGEMLNTWVTARDSISVVKLIDSILRDTEYQRYVNDGSEEGEERWENVMELRGVAAENPELTLGALLEEVALVADVDSLDENTNTGPTLLTLHSAKGLEFPVVFIAGLDEDIFPHKRSMDDAEEMAEERRLMYVGLTRAKDRIFLTRAFRRAMFGDFSVTQPSRFLADIPTSLLKGHVSKNSVAAYKQATTWDSPLDRPGRGGSVARPAKREAVVETGARYRTGQRVKHPLFGEGMIIESRGSGDDEIVTIAFEGTGIKRLAASMVELKVLRG